MGQVYRHIAPNGKSYVGKTIYTWQARAGSNPLTAYHGSYKFAAAIRKYGWESFAHEVLEENDNPVILIELETKWIDKLESIDNGYNLIRQFGGTNFAPNESIKQQLEESLEEIKTLYYDRCMSIMEVADYYGTTRRCITAFMEEKDLPRHHKGHIGEIGRKKNQVLSFIEPQVCPFCNVEFTPMRRGVTTCGKKSCSGKLNKANGHSDKNQSHITSMKIAKSMVGNKNSLGNVGGKIAAHNRWHVKRNMKSEECAYCE